MAGSHPFSFFDHHPIIYGTSGARALQITPLQRKMNGATLLMALTVFLGIAGCFYLQDHRNNLHYHAALHPSISIKYPSTVLRQLIANPLGAHYSAHMHPRSRLIPAARPTNEGHIDDDLIEALLHDEGEDDPLSLRNNKASTAWPQRTSELDSGPNVTGGWWDSSTPGPHLDIESEGSPSFDGSAAADGAKKEPTNEFKWWESVAAATAATAAVAGSAAVAGAAARLWSRSGAFGEARRSNPVYASPEEEKMWRTVHIRRCPEGVTDGHIYYHWRELGQGAIVDIAWVMQHGVFTGEAMVEFRTVALAHEAMMYEPMQFGTFKCYHQHCHWDFLSTCGNRTVFVSSCPPGMNEGHLWQYFSPLGQDAVWKITSRPSRGSLSRTMFVLFKAPYYVRRAELLPPLTIDGVVPIMHETGSGGKTGIDGKHVREHVLQLLKSHTLWKRDNSLSGVKELTSMMVVPRIWTRSQMEAQPFVKDLSNHLAPWVHQKTEAEVEAFFKESQIAVQGAPSLRPISEFGDVDFGVKVNRYMSDTFTSPTPLQCASWPAILSGRDILVTAPEGSGKVLAFVMPALVHVLAQPPVQPEEGPICLVIAPSREIVQKIYNELQQFEVPAEIQIAALYAGREGSSNRFYQAAKVFSGCEIVVGTMGRMFELWEAKALSLDRVTMAVIIEADIMLCGAHYEPQLRNIIDQVRPDRQLIFISSNWTPNAESMAQQYQDKPIKVSLGNFQETFISPNVIQRFVFPPPGREDREDMLLDILKDLKAKNPDRSQAIIYAVKAMVDHIAQGLSMYFPNVVAFRAGLSQSERDHAVLTMQTDPHAILVATDVAARGLDLPLLRCIINFQLPISFVNYAVRLGKAGREEPPVQAISFVTARDEGIVPYLIQGLMKVGQPIPTRLYDYLPRQPNAGVLYDERMPILPGEVLDTMPTTQRLLPGQVAGQGKSKGKGKGKGQARDQANRLPSSWELPDGD